MTCVQTNIKTTRFTMMKVRLISATDRSMGLCDVH